MFINRKPKLDLNRFDSIVSKDMVVRDGEIRYGGTLRVDGRVDCKITRNDGPATVIISEGAIVKTQELEAMFVVVRGRVQGDVTATEVIIENTGVVEGNIAYVRLRVDEGGTIHGRCKKIGQPEPAILGPVQDTPAEEVISTPS